MNGLSKFVLRHKVLVTLFWVAAMVAGMMAAGKLGDKFSDEFKIPGQEGYNANRAIVEKYHNGGEANPIIPVVSVSKGKITDDAELVAAFGAALDDLNQQGLRGISYPHTKDSAFITDDGKSMFAVVAMPPIYDIAERDKVSDAAVASLRSQLPVGATLTVTGLNELATADEQAEESSSGALIETLIGAGGALIILLFVFGSFMALVPLLVAAVSILTTFLAIYGVTHVLDMSEIVQYVVSLIGLGVAIDYSLLLVTRWREERGNGLDKVAATHKAMATAGRSVIFSGAAVAAGLLVLVLLPVPFLKTLGAGSVLIPLFSVLVTLTLLPVLLATIGDKLDWPRLRKEKKASALWTRWATGVVRRPWLSTVAALVVLVPLGVVAFTMQLGYTPSDSLNQSGEARTALTTLESNGVPTGVLTPIEVLIPAEQDAGAVTDELRALDGVYAVVTSEAWQRDGATLVQVLPTIETMTTDGRDVVENVQSATDQFSGVRVGGSGALLIADINSTYGTFPLMLALIALITFIMLVRAFRSIVLAIQAIVVNLLSIGAAYGVLVLVWQEGYGSEQIWDVAALGSVTTWVPLMTFAFLFGLSMDYQVFLLSRMREQYDETGSTSDAIVTGLGRIGRLVTCAALILFLAFMSMAAIPEVDVKVMATGMGAAILLDATIIRMLLVPALTAITGRWTWWLPSWAAKALFVAPSSAASHVASGRKNELISTS